jgi:diguanylate cyclase (GGDEF)-like protein
MFWSRSHAPKAEPSTKEEKPSLSPASDFDRALDTLGAVLRAFGDFAFDTDRATAVEVKERCAQLIRRVVLGDTRESNAGRENGTNGPPKRDFGSVHRYISEQRKYESEYVAASLRDLREAVRQFAQCLSEAICEDRQSDVRVEGQLVKLETAAKTGDTDTIRREALVATELVKEMIARRRDRETEQLVQLGKQVKTLRQELDEARAQAAVDTLTQLFNRAAFDDEIEKVARLGLLLGSEPCLIMVDVDHFKSINDRYGHPNGDLVLRAVADNLVRHFLRKEDFVTRYGGEEFAVVVRDSTLEKVSARIERAREVLSQLVVKTPAGDISVTQSAGVAALVPGESARSWVERADKALYAAKHAGRNNVRLANVEPVSERTIQSVTERSR